MFLRNITKRFISSSPSEGHLIIDQIRDVAKHLHAAKESSQPDNVYNTVVSQGVLKEDSHQEVVIKDLQILYNKILKQAGPITSKEVVLNTTGTNQSHLPQATGVANKKPGDTGTFGWLGKIFAPPEASVKQKDLVYGVEAQTAGNQNIGLSDPTINGAYLYGDVGCGKTILMDLLFACLELDDRLKHKIRRVHFNRFMLDVHKRLHRIKNEAKIEKSSDSPSHKTVFTASDVVPILADELIKECWVLCFDEFQVVDIADAMILKRLFTALWQRGMVCVITGNRKPDDLYKNGLQYQNFAPFIPILRQHTSSIFLNSGIDYRKLEISRFGDTFIMKEDKDCEERFQKLLYEITGIKSFDQMKERNLTVFGRNLKVKKTFERVACFNFNELCSQPLGAQDYLEIATYFDCLFIRDLPQIDLQTHRAEARRFITLIDQLYDCKCGVVFLAEAHDENIFTVKDTRRTSFTDEERIFMDDLKIAGTKAAEALSIISGEEEAFAMARLLSRLHEMKTQDYWDDVRRTIKLHRGEQF